MPGWIEEIAKILLRRHTDLVWRRTSTMGSPGCCRHGIEDELMSFLTFDNYYSPCEDEGPLAPTASAASSRALRMAALPPSPQLSRPLKPLMPATRTRPIPRMTTSEGLAGMGKVAKPIRQVSSPPSRPLAQDPHQRLVPASGGGGGRRRAAATATTSTLSPTHRSDPPASSAPRVLSLAKERLRQSIKERLAAKLQREQIGIVPPLLGITTGLPPRHSISSEQERFILELARRDSELQRMADARRRRRGSDGGGRSPVGSEGKVWDLDVRAWTGDGAEASVGGRLADPLLRAAMRGPEEHPVTHPDEMLADCTSADGHQETMPRWEESSPSAASMGSHHGGPLQEEWDPCLGEFLPLLLPHAPPERRELSEREFTNLFLNPTMAGGNHDAPPSMMMVMVPPTTTVAPTPYFDPTEMHHPEYSKASFWGY